jgi:prepilin-type N-terminal cleavage/methylation domain-containing protein
VVACYRKIQREKAAGLRDDSGFTLIELLIVIVVMGILAAVVIFALGGVTSKSAVSACNSDAKTVQLALASFQTQNPTYTTAITSGVLTGTTLGGPYMQGWPSSSNGYSVTLTGSTAATTVVNVTIGSGSATPYTGSAQCVGA